MKRILCLVMLFAVIGSTTFLNAQIPRLVYKVIPLTYGFSDNGNRNLPNGKEFNPKDRPTTRGNVFQPIDAYLYDSTVNIDFIDMCENVTITITHVVTGMVVYSETVTNTVNVSIDLSGNSSGEYLIEITSDGMLLEGGFIL